MNLANLRVAFIAGTLGGGGAERQLFYMVRALHEAGCGVQVLCLTRGDVWENRIRALGVPVVWVGQNGGRLARLSAIVWALWRLRPHVIQSAHFYTNVYAALAARVLGARDIGAIRSDALSEMRVYGRATGILSLRAPRLLAANSRAGVDNAVGLGIPAKRVRFLPNVLDAGHFAPAPSADGPFHLVAVGRLGPEKRFDRFIRVVARLRDSGPVRATLVGDGPLRAELEELVRELKLEGELEFTGAVPDTCPYFQRAHAAFLCSVYEGTPNVLLEAQSCGLPVISTDVGGISGIVQHEETGILIPVEGDEAFVVEGLATAAAGLRADAGRRANMGSAARAFVENQYDAARLPALLESLYCGALGSRRLIAIR